jgi:hypothetical protein
LPESQFLNEPLYLGITKWPQVLGEAFRCTKPGGYIELSESARMFGNYVPALHCGTCLIIFSIAYVRSDDGSLKDDNPVARWSTLLKDALTASGRVVPTEVLLRERLEKAGFVDVQSFTLPVPVGPWAKEKYEHCTAVHLSIVKTVHTHTSVYIGASRK